MRLCQCPSLPIIASLKGESLLAVHTARHCYRALTKMLPAGGDCPRQILLPFSILLSSRIYLGDAIDRARTAHAGEGRAKRGHSGVCLLPTTQCPPQYKRFAWQPRKPIFIGARRAFALCHTIVCNVMNRAFDRSVRFAMPLETPCLCKQCET